MKRSARRHIRRFGRGEGLSIKTYQDLLEVGEDEQNRMEFIRAAIEDHRSSEAYRTAIDAEEYYYGTNPTISHYEKVIYDLQGRAHRDMYTANHKLSSRFFGMAVDQEASYLLGNGVTFQQDSTSDKLGKGFDQDILHIAALPSSAVWRLACGTWITFRFSISPNLCRSTMKRTVH